MHIARSVPWLRCNPSELCIHCFASRFLNRNFRRFGAVYSSCCACAIKEMLSAVASPWLPALQAIARRRVALSPKLEADRKRREEAAVEIQRHLRGTTTRRNMQEQQMETNAQNLVAGVLKAIQTFSDSAEGCSRFPCIERLEALKWRKSMANASIQQALSN